jgi:arsenite methyltransferase
MTHGPDHWYQWIRGVRYGADEATREHDMTTHWGPWRDEILARADVLPGETVLDVGCGDGLIAFGAVDQVGPDGHVIFSDVSADLLDCCRSAAQAAGVAERCSFVQTSADSLDGIDDQSADVVTTRSVLIYVADKAAALRSFYRVLRPGGRISLFEPINRRMTDAQGRFYGYDVGPVAEIGAKLAAYYDSLQPADSPMLDFDDGDLMRLAEQAGFPDVALDLRVSVEPRTDPVPWDVFLRSSGNPLQPPFGSVLEEVLTPEERSGFTEAFRPLVESGTGQRRRALAFLVARKQLPPK